MDGHFVPNLSMGPAVVKALRKVTRLPLEVHLMVNEPAKFVDAFIREGANRLIVHLEVLPDPLPLFERIRAQGKSVGLAINPQTDVSGFERDSDHRITAPEGQVSMLSDGTSEALAWRRNDPAPSASGSRVNGTCAREPRSCYVCRPLARTIKRNNLLRRQGFATTSKNDESSALCAIGCRQAYRARAHRTARYSRRL